MPFLSRVSPDFGIDTASYLTQAGQFWSGQTNITRINGPEGQSFYPAGHLVHYVPFYLLFKNRMDAFYFLQLFYIGIYLAIIGLATRVAQIYFKRSPAKAQLIGFMLAMNPTQINMVFNYFNDSFVQLYSVACVYFLINKRPWVGSAMIGMALTVKAGALMALPAILGTI